MRWKYSAQTTVEQRWENSTVGTVATPFFSTVCKEFIAPYCTCTRTLSSYTYMYTCMYTYTCIHYNTVNPEMLAFLNEFNDQQYFINIKGRQQ